MIMRGLLLSSRTTTSSLTTTSKLLRASTAPRPARAPAATSAATGPSAGAAITTVVAAPARVPLLSQTKATTLLTPPTPTLPTLHHRSRPALRAMAASASSPNAAPIDWAALGLSPNPGEDVAVVGGGCFWCVETALGRLRGVSSAISGYAGGHVERPTYEEVCDKKTGHAEVVAVYYDPKIVSYETILEVFFALHDPTTLNQQGNDVGPQYRSAVYTIGDEQRAVAERVMKRVSDDKIWGSKPLTTELAPLKPGPARFHPAEKYHQRYYEINGDSNPYCAFVVAPKVQKLRAKFAALLKEGA